MLESDFHVKNNKEASMNELQELLKQILAANLVVIGYQQTIDSHIRSLLTIADKESVLSHPDFDEIFNSLKQAIIKVEQTPLDSLQTRHRPQMKPVK